MVKLVVCDRKSGIDYYVMEPHAICIKTPSPESTVRYMRKAKLYTPAVLATLCAQGAMRKFAHPETGTLYMLVSSEASKMAGGSVLGFFGLLRRRFGFGFLQSKDLKAASVLKALLETGDYVYYDARPLRRAYGDQNAKNPQALADCVAVRLEMERQADKVLHEIISKQREECSWAPGVYNRVSIFPPMIIPPHALSC